MEAAHLCLQVVGRCLNERLDTGHARWHEPVWNAVQQVDLAGAADAGCNGTRNIGRGLCRLREVSWAEYIHDILRYIPD